MVVVVGLARTTPLDDFTETPMSKVIIVIVIVTQRHLATQSQQQHTRTEWEMDTDKARTQHIRGRGCIRTRGHSRRHAHEP